ncbi:DUF1285 domain-containing protein [Pararhodospirillum photometricum]|uniref:Proteophosphoglycan n=1 Tax=Pararhodospirillum photometricum DSM 122 TaxID=1150469 RepID=H6SSA8_PARPM|nr:DUF1285 domain-containing protein [Pararhodospirillum photometricum]CCG07787.1 Putative uncharacterized protein [Pararhodospirillum photometricum DSM 122]
MTHNVSIDPPSRTPPSAVAFGATGQDADDCGDLPLRIDAEGLWTYRGSPIGRKEMVCLFATMLRRARDGSFWLIAPGERVRIAVEDAPFLAVEMFKSGGCGEGQVLSFRTNVDEIVTVDAAHPLRVEHDPLTGEPRPYVLVRPGLEARLTRAVFYQLAARAVERHDGETTCYGVWSSGGFFRLGCFDGSGAVMGAATTPCACSEKPS